MSGDLFSVMQCMCFYLAGDLSTYLTGLEGICEFRALKWGSLGGVDGSEVAYYVGFLYRGDLLFVLYFLGIWRSRAGIHVGYLRHSPVRFPSGIALVSHPPSGSIMVEDMGTLTAVSPPFIIFVVVKVIMPSLAFLTPSTVPTRSTACGRVVRFPRWESILS